MNLEDYQHTRKLEAGKADPPILTQEYLTREDRDYLLRLAGLAKHRKRKKRVCDGNYIISTGFSISVIQGQYNIT